MEVAAPARQPDAATDPASTAGAASVCALVNALLRELPWTARRLHGTRAAAAGAPRAAVVALPGGGWLLAGLHHAGRCGRVAPSGHVAVTTAQGVRRIEIEELIALALPLAGIPDPDGTRVRTLTARVRASRRVMEHHLGQSVPGAGAWRFCDGERALAFGHPVHPAPRAVGDEQSFDPAWLPGSRGGFALHWVAVDPACLDRHALAMPAATLARQLAADDPLGVPGAPREGQLVVPLHPLQATALRADPAACALADAGALTHLGPAGSRWHATASVRTLYAPHARYMLKCSLPVRITNSQRLIREGELARGPLLRHALRSARGQALARTCATLRVLHEPGHFAVRDRTGAPLAASAVIVRENPWRHGAGGAACMLATLCELYPDGSAPTLRRAIAAACGAVRPASARRWFARYLEVVYRPLVLAHAQFGLALGAHVQNVVVALDGGWPSGAWYRDCQGSGFTRRAFAHWCRAVPDLRGADNVYDDTLAVRLGSYYLGVNHVLALTAALSLSGLAREAALLETLRDFLNRLRATGLRDPSLVDHLLDAPDYLAKGNLSTFALEVDENASTTAPLAAYARLRNPLRGA